MSSFWAGKRVVVTGHMGFKGGWLSLWLERLGAHVTGFCDRPPSEPNLFTRAQVARGVRSVTGDVRELAAVKDVIAHARPEIVFHLAAQSLVRESYRRPVDTFASNVMGTVNVLEAIRATPGVRVAVVVTSDKCYENREWHWGYRESDAVGGYDPYSASKGAAEIVTAAYRRSFFTASAHGEASVAVASARAGNVIGGGDWGAEKLIPDIVRAFGRGEEVLIRSPAALRPWQHVLDALYGYLLLVERLWADPAAAQAWNFGPSEADTRTVRWVVERAAQLWGGGASWRVDTAPAPHEATLLKLDSSKARSLLEWTPRLDLATALDWTVQWYRQDAMQAGMRDVTLAQIDQFMARTPRQ
jgi:CDP-glucose 4,6-dehydratase